MIAVIQAHKEGKKIQNRYAMQPGESNRYNEFEDIENPSWNFNKYDYRVAPEPRKPREWWIEPLKYGLCRMSEEASTCALWHVREVIE